MIHRTDPATNTIKAPNMRPDPEDQACPDGGPVEDKGTSPTAIPRDDERRPATERPGVRPQLGMEIRMSSDPMDSKLHDARSVSKRTAEEGRSCPIDPSMPGSQPSDERITGKQLDTLLELRKGTVDGDCDLEGDVLESLGVTDYDQLSESDASAAIQVFGELKGDLPMSPRLKRRVDVAVAKSMKSDPTRITRCLKKIGVGGVEGLTTAQAVQLVKCLIKKP